MNKIFCFVAQFDQKLILTLSNMYFPYYQVRELLKRKQSVLGADRLHDEMEDVSSRWKALHDAFKDKLVLYNNLRYVYCIDAIFN